MASEYLTFLYKKVAFLSELGQIVFFDNQMQILQIKLCKSVDYIKYILG